MSHAWDRIRGAVNISFQTGHGARHLRGTTLDVDEVERAIEASILLTTRHATAVGGSFWGRVVVSMYVVEYRGFALALDNINVGTYYILRMAR